MPFWPWGTVLKEQLLNSDYDTTDKATRQFFDIVQDLLIYADFTFFRPEGPKQNSLGQRPRKRHPPRFAP